MLTHYINLLSLITFIALSGNVSAQQNIPISDSLKINAEALVVDVDYPVGNNVKFRMGDYTIMVDNEMSSTDYHTNESWQGLNVNTITKTVFLTISDSSLNKAAVTIVKKNKENSIYQNETHNNFRITSDNSGKVNAWITITVNGSEPWTLFIILGKGNEWTPPFEMRLSRGKEKISLINVSSDAHFNYSHPFRSLDKNPAMGVEFFQNEKSVCAIQYDAGAANDFYTGPGQSLGCKAWMLYDLDTKTRLMLAAAMSTLILLNNPSLRLIE